MIINTGSRTDIPAFYSEWFYRRIREGFVMVRNPYRPTDVTRYLLDPSVADMIAFCTKNPAPMLGRLHELDAFRTFFMVTITPYGKDIEPYVPEPDRVMDAFAALSEYAGRNAVSWRYDPVLITDRYPVDFHKSAFEKMAGKLKNWTDQCVVSFVDLYEKTKRNFPGVRNVTQSEQRELIRSFGETAERLDMQIHLCLEDARLVRPHVDAGGCMSREVVEKAIGQIETAGRKNDKVFVVYLPDMHESIAGLIAGKIREKYNHPVFVLTKSDKEGTIKGSGRSIEAYNMFEALEECSEYLLKYGGHKMAAGITLREDALEAFRQALNEKCTLKPENFIPRILIDVPLPLGYISEELIRQLDLIEPCGNGNTKPIFGQLNVPVKGARFIGQVRRFIRFRLADPVHGTMNAIYFGDSDEMMEYLTGKFGRDEVDRMMAGMPSRVTLSITYYPQVSEYRSLRSLQIIRSNYR